MEVAQAGLEMWEIDTLGLDKLDRRYLETLLRVFAGGPAGIEAISHTMTVPTDTLVDETEPFLLRSELIIRTPRGRMATEKAAQHIGIPLELPSPHQPQAPLFGSGEDSEQPG